METEWLTKVFMQQLSKDSKLQNTIKPSICANDFRILSVDHEPAVGKGENYTSILRRYRIVLERSDGVKIVKHIIAKFYPECPGTVLFCKETPIFKNEIFVYSVVLKEMEALMKEFNDQQEKLWCDLIGYRRYDRIALEDLRDENFSVMNRHDMLDYDHSVLAVKSLARYHAMSAIIVNRSIIKPTDFGTLLFVSNKQMIDLFFNSFFITFAETVRDHWGPEWSELVEHLNAAIDSIEYRYTNMIELNNNRFNVINHGDCWTNNMMFRHEEGSDKPLAIRFIDHQMGHYNSFAWDLTYFLYNSTWPDIRRSRYTDLLSEYHASLKDTFHFYSYPTDSIPNLDYIIKEMDRLKFFGLGELISIHAFTSTEVIDSYDLNLSYCSKENRAVGINTEIFTSKKFRFKVEEDMKAFLREGVI